MIKHTISYKYFIFNGISDETNRLSQQQVTLSRSVFCLDCFFFSLEEMNCIANWWFFLISTLLTQIGPTANLDLLILLAHCFPYGFIFLFFFFKTIQWRTAWNNASLWTIESWALFKAIDVDDEIDSKSYCSHTPDSASISAHTQKIGTRNKSNVTSIPIVTW